MPLSPRHLRALALLGVPILLAFAWVSFMGYQGLNGQDAHDYLRLARGWTAWAMDGAPLPRLFEHPHGYPIAGALLGLLMGPTLALRTISAAALLVLALTLRGVLRRAFPRERALVDTYLLLAVVLAPFLLRHALVVMSDLPGMALLALAYAATVRWLHERRAWLLAGALVAMVLAVSVRFATAPLMGLLLLALVHGRAPGRRLRWGLLLGLGALTAIVLFAVVPLEGLRTLIAHSPLGDWSAMDLFRRELRSDDGVLRYRFPNILYVLGIGVHPGFLPIGVLVLPFVKRTDLRPLHARLALVLLVCYLLFIAGMPFQNDRVLMLGQPFVAVLLFPAFTRALRFATERKVRPAWAMTALVVVQVALFVRAMLPFIAQAAIERALAAQVNAQQAARVYTHGMGAAFSNLCPGVEVTELWYGAIDHFAPGALVVVRPKDLHDQWQGLPPAVNWDRAQVQGLRVLEVRPDGWTIAVVR